MLCLALLFLLPTLVISLPGNTDIVFKVNDRYKDLFNMGFIPELIEELFHPDAVMTLLIRGNKPKAFTGSTLETHLKELRKLFGKFTEVTVVFAGNWGDPRLFTATVEIKMERLSSSKFRYSETIRDGKFSEILVEMFRLN